MTGPLARSDSEEDRVPTGDAAAASPGAVTVEEGGLAQRSRRRRRRPPSSGSTSSASPDRRLPGSFRRSVHEPRVDAGREPLRQGPPGDDGRPLGCQGSRLQSPRAGSSGHRLARHRNRAPAHWTPAVNLHGRAAKRAEQLGMGRVAVSISHEADFAVAIAFGIRTAGGRFLYPPDIERASQRTRSHADAPFRTVARACQGRRRR